MNTSTNTIHLIPAETVPEGAGVTVYRTIGSANLRNYDPFLLLDHIGSDNPKDYAAGFPAHPHRGFNTFTYMIDGFMAHQDSMGNRGNLNPGSAQWMKAGSGIIHSEMPQQENGLMRGFQLWINLPATNKMDRPEYQEYPADDFPIVQTPDYTLKVLIGRFSGAVSPIEDTVTQVTYFDVTVQAEKSFRYRFPAQNHSFLYVFEGDGKLNDQHIAQHTLATLNTSEDGIDFVAGKTGARLIAVSGKPIREPVVRYGPFVMNTREQIDQALQDFQSNQFVRDRAWIKRNQ